MQLFSVVPSHPSCSIYVDCLFSVEEKVLNPSVDPSRNAVLPEFMNKEAKAHFVDFFGEVQD